MHYAQHIKQALTNLASAKLRSFLAVLGILVGTAAVVALLSSGELATRQALAQFKLLGTELVSVSLFNTEKNEQSNEANTLSLSELLMMRSAIPQVREVAPYARGFQPVIYHGRRLRGSIIGATETLKHLLKFKMRAGGFIAYADHYARFCVIGHDLYKQMVKLSARDPLGQQIQLGETIFTIIGILEPWESNGFFYSNANDAVFIPLPMIELINKESSIDNVVISLEKSEDPTRASNAIRRYVRQHAPKKQLYIRSAKALVQSMVAQRKIFTILLGAIGGIALLVGGIGVMNIMLVSVTERRREIGIRKAIGARRKDIQLLFLFEAMVLGLFGGLLGVIVGIVASYVIAHFAKWSFYFFIFPPIIGFVVSAATGIFFGFYPAHRAARLDPIEALRYE